MINKEFIEIENKINVLEDLIEKNENFIYEDEFNTIVDAILEKIEWETDCLKAYFEQDKRTEMGEEAIHKELKILSKLKKRIDNIQDEAGIESEDNIRSFMFPNDDDDIND